MVTMQVTLLFQGFSEDGVLTRWFLGKFASGSCLAMENQTELVQERAESWAPGIRAPGLQWPVLLGSFGSTSRLMPHPGQTLVSNLSHLQWSRDTLPSQCWDPSGNPAWETSCKGFLGHCGSALSCTSARFGFLWPLCLSLPLLPCLPLPPCQRD